MAWYQCPAPSHHGSAFCAGNYHSDFLHKLYKSSCILLFSSAGLLEEWRPRVKTNYPIKMAHSRVITTYTWHFAAHSASQFPGQMWACLYSSGQIPMSAWLWPHVACLYKVSPLTNGAGNTWHFGLIVQLIEIVRTELHYTSAIESAELGK